MYSFGRLPTLFASVLRSFTSNFTYILGQIVDCLDDFQAIVKVRPLGRRIESSCGRILPVPRPISYSVYSLGQLPTLFASVLRSFTSNCTYILGRIVDCLSRPSSHSSSGTFGGAYLIFLWSYFARFKTCIINCVLSWSIPYILYVGAPLLCLDPYIHLRVYCWLSETNFQP